MERSRGSGFRSVAVELPDDVESRDEADEAETHHQNHRRADPHPRRIIRVEPEHVGTGSSTAADVRGRSASEPATAHSRRGGGGAARGRSHDARARGGSGGRLRL